MPVRCSETSELGFPAGAWWRERRKDHGAVPKVPGTEETLEARLGETEPCA